MGFLDHRCRLVAALASVTRLLLPTSFARSRFTACGRGLAVALATRHQRLGDPTNLVRERDRSDARVLSAELLDQPWRASAEPLCMPDHAIAPTNSKLRKYVSPALVILPRRSLSPDEFCRARPSHADRLRPVLKTFGSGMVATARSRSADQHQGSLATDDGARLRSCVSGSLDRVSSRWSSTRRYCRRGSTGTHGLMTRGGSHSAQA